MPTLQKRFAHSSLDPVSRDSMEKILKEEEARRVRKEAEGGGVKIVPAQGRPDLRASEIYSRRKAATQQGSAK